MKIKFPLVLAVSLLLSLTAFLSNSCNKEQFFSKGNLSFSVDTVVFDTVFTTIGSTTQSFKFYNKDNRNLKVEEIQLMGGSSSPFRINIDGISGIFHKDIEMLAKDSLFGFVEVTLQANQGTQPLIIEDSIRFRTNGKDQYLKLAVWGQDAYFHYNDLNEGTWENDKPHVIYGAAYVDSAKTLTIPKNTKIHLHKGSMLFVYKGTLNIEGEKGEEVQMLGDRLEASYADVSGQYYGIYMHEAKPSTINYLIQKNGSSGIHMTGYNPSNSPTDFNLTIKNSILTNNANYGFFLYDGAKLKAENCVISRNTTHALFILRGATYDLTHCTITGYSSSKAAAIGIRNYYDGVAMAIPSGHIKNSVIYGNQNYEIALDTVNPNNDPNFLNFRFDNCVIKYKEGSTHSMFNSVHFNEDPKFEKPNENKFKPQAGSSLANRGNANFALPFDIEGTARDLINPDLGAYEF